MNRCIITHLAISPPKQSVQPGSLLEVLFPGWSPLPPGPWGVSQKGVVVPQLCTLMWYLISCKTICKPAEFSSSSAVHKELSIRTQVPCRGSGNYGHWGSSFCNLLESSGPAQPDLIRILLSSVWWRMPNFMNWWVTSHSISDGQLRSHGMLGSIVNHLVSVKDRIRKKAVSQKERSYLFWSPSFFLISQGCTLQFTDRTSVCTAVSTAIGSAGSHGSGGRAASPAAWVSFRIFCCSRPHSKLAVFGSLGKQVTCSNGDCYFQNPKRITRYSIFFWL